jgi:hypothetical protein
MPHEPQYLLTSEAARILGVSGQTMLAWDRLYARADIEALCRSRDAQRSAKAPASGGL